MTRRWMGSLLLLGAIACGDDGAGAAAGTSGGGDGSGDGASVGTDMIATGDDTTASAGADADGPASSGSDGGDTGSGSSSSGPADESTGGPVLECEPPDLTSTCANPNSIVRGVVVLGVDDVPTTGTLRIHLNHEYLGGGATGGIAHSSTYVSEVDLAAGPVAFAVDMCVAGEMWSEENCGFMLHVTLDADADGSLDPGEPTGSVPLFLSCTGDPLCTEVVLDCIDGSSCVAFDDPPYCGCPSTGQSCASPIVAC